MEKVEQKQGVKAKVWLAFRNRGVGCSSLSTLSWSEQRRQIPVTQMDKWREGAHGVDGVVYAYRHAVKPFITIVLSSH